MPTPALTPALTPKSKATPQSVPLDLNSKPAKSLVPLKRGNDKVTTHLSLYQHNKRPVQSLHHYLEQAGHPEGYLDVLRWCAPYSASLPCLFGRSPIVDRQENARPHGSG